MSVSTGTIRAVNPLALAHISGVTKVPRFAAPIAPVIRPNLLTTQLMGCCSNCAAGTSSGPIGLSGFIPPDYGSLRGEASTLYSTRSWSHGLRGEDSTTYNTRSWSHGLRGLGIASNPNVIVPSDGSGNLSVLDMVSAGASAIPGVGPVAAITAQSVVQMIQQFGAWLGIGAGRHEADIIVPVQNNLMTSLGTITNQILTGSTASADTLAGFYQQVWILGVAFQEFVLQKTFTDRRASGQALNTVMPYIDGSCGYPVPVGPTATPGAQNCLTWGDGTLGGPGTNGMLGALGRAIANAGGSTPVLMDLHQAANRGLPPQTAATVNPVTGTIPGTIPAGSGTVSIAGTTMSSGTFAMFVVLGFLIVARLGQR